MIMDDEGSNNNITNILKAYEVVMISIGGALFCMSVLIFSMLGLITILLVQLRNIARTKKRKQRTSK